MLCQSLLYSKVTQLHTYMCVSIYIHTYIYMYIYTFFFSYSFLLWFIAGDWI